MARRCIGYEGDGRRRRPIWRDEGPASARGESPIVTGAPQLFGNGSSLLPTGGAGPVERRRATPAELASRLVEELPSPIAPRPRPTPIERESATVSIASPPPPSALAMPPWPAQFDLPCAGCLHAAVCSIKPRLEDWSLGGGLESPDPAVTVSVVVRLDCSHRLEGNPTAAAARLEALTPVDAPGRSEEPAQLPESTPIPIAAGRASAQLPAPSKRFPLPRDRAARDELFRRVLPGKTRGEVARELGVSTSRVDQVIADVRVRGALPSDLEVAWRTRNLTRKAASA